MKTLIRIFHVMMWVGLATSVYAQSSLSGKTIRLPPDTPLIKASDNSNLRTAKNTNVVVRDPVLSSNKKLMFPVKVGSGEYYVREETLISLGYIKKTECNALRSKMSSRNRSDLSEVARAASNVRVTLNNIPSPNSGWAKSCQNFIQSNGSIGSWGQSFLNSAASTPAGQYNALTILKQPMLWSRVCPGFSNFSEDQKQHFIVTFIATKAMDEASCNPKARNNRTPNPPGVGFFQLEGQAKLRKSRGAACAGGHSSGVQKELPNETQFKCAASQIVSTQWNQGRPFCTSGGYWQEANSMSGDICKSMSKYPGCGG